MYVCTWSVPRSQGDFPPHPTTLHPTPQCMIRAECERLVFTDIVPARCSFRLSFTQSQSRRWASLICTPLGNWVTGHNVQYRMSGGGRRAGFDILKITQTCAEIESWISNENKDSEPPLSRCYRMLNRLNRSDFRNFGVRNSLSVWKSSWNPPLFFSWQ
jgi:hypothetical protein